MTKADGKNNSIIARAKFTVANPKMAKPTVEPKSGSLKVGDRITLTSPDKGKIVVMRGTTQVKAVSSGKTYKLVAEDFKSGKLNIKIHATGGKNLSNSDSVSLTNQQRLRNPTASPKTGATVKVGKTITFKSADAGDIIVTVGGVKTTLKSGKPYTYTLKVEDFNKKGIASIKIQATRKNYKNSATVKLSYSLKK